MLSRFAGMTKLRSRTETVRRHHNEIRARSVRHISAFTSLAAVLAFSSSAWGQMVTITWAEDDAATADVDETKIVVPADEVEVNDADDETDDVWVLKRNTGSAGTSNAPSATAALATADDPATTDVNESTVIPASIMAAEGYNEYGTDATGTASCAVGTVNYEYKPGLPGGVTGGGSSSSISVTAASLDPTETQTYTLYAYVECEDTITYTDGAGVQRTNVIGDDEPDRREELAGESINIEVKGAFPTPTISSQLFDNTSPPNLGTFKEGRSGVVEVAPLTTLQIDELVTFTYEAGTEKTAGAGTTVTPTQFAFRGVVDDPDPDGDPATDDATSKIQVCDAASSCPEEGAGAWADGTSVDVTIAPFDDN